MKHFRAIVLTGAVMALAPVAHSQAMRSTMDPLAPVDASVDAALPARMPAAVLVDPTGQGATEIAKRSRTLDELTPEQRKKLAASSTGAAMLQQSSNRTTLQSHTAQIKNLIREEEQSRSVDEYGGLDLARTPAGVSVRGKTARSSKAQPPASALQRLSGLQSRRKLDPSQDFTSVDAGLPLPGLSLQTDYDPGSKLGFASAKELDFNPVSMRPLRSSEKRTGMEPKRDSESRQEARESRHHKLGEMSPGKRRLKELSEPDTSRRMKDEVLHPH